MKKLLSCALAALIAMGSVSALSVGATTSPPPASAVQADVDKDGTMSVLDVTEIQKYVASLTDFSGDSLIAADVDGDGEVMITDATCVQKLLVSLINKQELKSFETDSSIKEKGSLAMNNFAAELLKTSVEQGENTLVSPLSVMYALAMTANGAKGATLREMEETLGMTNYQMNRYFHMYPKLLKNPGSVGNELSIANSIWFNNAQGMPSVSRYFLGSSQDFYNADIYPVEFNNAALNQINGWVNEKTHGMIPSILDEVDPYAFMYLINALAFEAEWAEQYTNIDVHEKTFTPEAGKNVTADFLCSQEDYYITDGDDAVGFVKEYRGGNFAFAALLPSEGTSLDSYVQSLTGERIMNALKNKKYSAGNVNVWLPKFEVEYDDLLNDNLQSMGMNLPFSGAADFSRMLSNPSQSSLSISRVIHKTYILLNELGTKAGAATVVEMKETCMPPSEDEVDVHLTRPFVYMLINLETNSPMFIGTIETLP